MNPDLSHCRRILYQPQGKPKNTGVGSLSLLQRIFPTQKSNCGLLHCRRIFYQPSHQRSLLMLLLLLLLSRFSRVRLCATPWTAAHQVPRPWDSPGKNTGVGCHFLLQGYFPTQGWNLGFLHCRQILHQLSYEGSPIRISQKVFKKEKLSSSRIHYCYIISSTEFKLSCLLCNHQFQV